MKHLIFLSIGCAVLTHTIAQEEEPPVPARSTMPANTNRVFGKITDSKTGKGLDAITVQLYALVPGAGATNDSLAGSLFTRSNGDFNFTNVPMTDSLRLVISAVGFGGKQLMVPFGAARGGQRFVEKDLGNIVYKAYDAIREVLQAAGYKWQA